MKIWSKLSKWNDLVMPKSTDTIDKINDLTLIFKNLLSDGKTDEALSISQKILQEAQSIEQRNHEIEAWIRMERALLGAIDVEKIGDELRWCLDRIEAISPGSTLHGLALLNLSSWHRNKDEYMMSLVLLSDISIEKGHGNEVVGLARLESGRLLIQMEDLESASRHLWISRKYLSETSMTAECLTSSLEWLNLSLDVINTDSPSMNDKIENAKPKIKSENSNFGVNPIDIIELIDEIFPIISKNLSGEGRDDLGLIIDATTLLNENKWISSLRERKSEIQDPRIVAALQS